MSGANDTKINSLEFSLDDDDLNRLKNHHSLQSKKEEAFSSVDVADMEISWEDSLEALREERAKLNQQVLQQNTLIDVVPDIFEQMVQEAMQKQGVENEGESKVDVFEEEVESPFVVEYDESLTGLLNAANLEDNQDAKTAIGSQHAHSVSFEEVEAKSHAPIESKPEIELSFEVPKPLPEFDYIAETSVVQKVVIPEAEGKHLETDSAQIVDFEKIKQEALARVQQKQVPQDSLVQMVNPAINFGTLKKKEPDKTPVSERKLGEGGFSATQIAAVANGVKLHPASVAEIASNPETINTQALENDDEQEINKNQVEPTEEVINQIEEGVIENVPELNLAVPENNTDYAAEVVTKEPVSLVGETQLIAAIVADLQPQLEKIFIHYVQTEIQKQTEILLKNLTVKMEEDFPILLSKIVVARIKDAIQRVKNPL